MTTKGVTEGRRRLPEGIGLWGVVFGLLGVGGLVLANNPTGIMLTGYCFGAAAVLLGLEVHVR